MYNMNLLPPKLRKNRKNRIKFDNPTYGLVLLLLVLMTIFFVNKELKNQLQEVNLNTSKLQGDINTIMPMVNELSVPVEDNSKTNLQSSLQKIKDLVNGGLPWIEVLDEISALTPPSVTITSIKESANNMVTIEAETFTLSDMAKMKESFNQETSKFSGTTIDTYSFTQSTIIEHPQMKVTFTLISTFGDTSTGEANITTTENLGAEYNQTIETPTDTLQTENMIEENNN